MEWTYIRLADTICLLEGNNRSMHEKVQQVRIQWGSGLVRMKLEMRDHGRFEEHALAGGSAEILDGCEVITQSRESHKG